MKRKEKDLHPYSYRGPRSVYHGPESPPPLYPAGVEDRETWTII